MTRDAKIGLTLLAGLLLLYLVIAWTKGLHFFSVNHSEYRVEFSNASGLKVGDPVYVNGVPGGKVLDIFLVEGGVGTTLGIEENIVLYKNAKAEIRLKELMGGKMVEIDPGGKGAILEEGQVLKGGTSMDFSTAFSKFGKIMGQMEENGLDSLWIRIDQISASIVRLSRQLESEEGSTIIPNLAAAARDLRILTKQVNEQQLALRMGNALSGFDTLSMNALEVMSGINTLIADIQGSTLPMGDSLLGKMDQLITDGQSVLHTFEETFEELKKKETLLGKALFDKKSARELQETMENLNKTLDHLRDDKLQIGIRMGKRKD